MPVVQSRSLVTVVDFFNVVNFSKMQVAVH